MVYRRAWMTILSGFFEPIFYLFSLGIGLGHFVGQHSRRVVRELHRAGASRLRGDERCDLRRDDERLLEAPLRQGVRLDARDSARPDRRRGRRDGVGAVPRRPLRDRLRRTAAALGLLHSWWAVLALPAALVVGFGFAGIGIAASTFLRSWQDFEMVQIVLLPMFLFSATFFPISIYPVAIQWFVRVSPLYHSITLIRALTLGSVGWINLLNAAYLLTLGVIGIVDRPAPHGRAASDLGKSGRSWIRTTDLRLIRAAL